MRTATPRFAYAALGFAYVALLTELIWLLFFDGTLGWITATAVAVIALQAMAFGRFRVVDLVARVILGLRLLGSVADRFGLFGGPGSSGVAYAVPVTNAGAALLATTSGGLQGRDRVLRWRFANRRKGKTSMRRTVLATVTLVAALAGFTTAAGPAGAVSDTETCVSIKEMATELNAGLNGAKNKEGSATEVKGLFAGAATKLEGAGANADEGPVKTAIDPAVAQMKRVSTASDADLGAVLQDQTFHDAMSGLDTACGI